MDTTHDIVAVEAEYRSLLHDPRRSLRRFVELSLSYGRMLADHDPAQAAEVYWLAIDTLHDPPAAAEAEVALQLVRALRPVAGRLGDTDLELDTLRRERRMLDAGYVAADPGVRDELCRRAAAAYFAAGDVTAGFMELMDGVRGCTADGLDALATDLVVAVRQRHVPADLIADIENLWVELRRRSFDGNWPLWCLTALGALRLDAGDVMTAQMYVRRAESILGQVQRPVAGSLVAGWVALSADDFERARERFAEAVGRSSPDVRLRLLASAGLGEALICLGRTDDARAPLAEAISYDVGDPQSVARCHELLADVAAADGRFADAYEHAVATRRLEFAARGVETPIVRRIERPVTEDPVVEEPSTDHLVTAAPTPERIEPAPVEVVISEPATAATAAPTALAPADVVDLRDGPPVDPVLAALRAGRAELFFQVIVENARDRVGAVEARARFRGEDGLWVDVADVVAHADPVVAEEALLWLLTSAGESLARWIRLGEQVAVVVEITESQLTAALPLLVRTALARTGVPADRVTIEVEGSAAKRLDAARAGWLEETRALGVRIGVDRFGDEFRSVDALLRLPIDVVTFAPKVFGAGVPRPLERRMIETVVALSRAFGFDVIASGIDTAAQRDLQQEFGCDGAQGDALGPWVREADLGVRVGIGETA